MHLLITGAWQGAQEYIPELEAKGHEIIFLQQERDGLPCEPEWVEGVVCNGLFLYHPIEAFANLRYIQLTSAGYDRVPMDYVEKHGIEIRNAKGVYSVPMAEFAVCGVLQLYKQSRFFYENQKLHKWEKHRGLMELSGKTVLIVGCGDVGTECARRFRAFGCKVVGVNRTVREDASFDEFLSLDVLDLQLPKADVVILAIGLSEETRHIMSPERLKKMKPSAVLVNLARGGLIDSDALVSASDNLRGAVLDVFEDEPLNENSPLWGRDNILLTPHNSFVGEGNRRRLSNLIIQNVS